MGGLLGGGLKGVFEGREGFGEVFWERGRNDFEIC